jgi:hypothetical protein
MCDCMVPVMSLHHTDFSPLDAGTKAPGWPSVSRCLCWLPMALLALALTALALLVGAPWACVRWLCGYR